MAIVNTQGYVERKTSKGKVYREWWLLKAGKDKGGGSIFIGPLNFPKHMEGKKIRIKVEVIGDVESLDV